MGMLVPWQLVLQLSALVLQAGATAQATVTMQGGDEADDATTAAHRLPGIRVSLSRARPAMTPYQQQYMAAVEAEAKAASDAATPFVLAALEDPWFRAGLHACCPSVASLNSESLLQRFRDETAISEMTHSFDVDLSDSGGHMAGGVGGKNGNFLGDPPLAVYMNSSHFYNLWEVAYLNITSYQALHAEVGAEEGLFVSGALAGSEALPRLYERCCMHCIVVVVFVGFRRGSAGLPAAATPATQAARSVCQRRSRRRRSVRYVSPHLPSSPGRQSSSFHNYHTNLVASNA